MLTLHGGCHCGRIRVRAELSQAPGCYSVRACDCDFCQKHAAAYLSDPAGRLYLRFRSQSEVNCYRQGSEAAELLLCAHCGVLVAVRYGAEDNTYGAINVRALEEAPEFGARTPVSPRTLSPAEKIARWKQLWFAHVEESYDR
jgi:hypothetical protein